MKPNAFRPLPKYLALSFAVSALLLSCKEKCEPASDDTVFYAGASTALSPLRKAAEKGKTCAAKKGYPDGEVVLEGTTGSVATLLTDLYEAQGWQLTKKGGDPDVLSLTFRPKDRSKPGQALLMLSGGKACRTGDVCVDVVEAADTTP